MNAVLMLFKVVGVAAQSAFWNIFWAGVIVAVVILISLLGLGYLAAKLIMLIPPLPWW